MKDLLPYIQVVLSILLVVGILLQRSEAGLGTVFGSDTGATRFERRGFEKTLFQGTIVIAVLFVLVSFASIFFRS